MYQDGDFPFCGAAAAYVKEMQNGPIRQKLYRGGFIFFTDAVVFIRPPSKARMAAVGGTLLGATLGGDAGLHTMAELSSLSAEKQVERINERLEAVFKKYNMGQLTSAVIVSEFGDWTEVWPNSKVVQASMKIKGIWPKRLHVTLTPNSGLKVGYDTTPDMVPTMRGMLRKAFGSRFVEG